ncbi:MAG: DNA gyrase inhibitor YacG [Gemmatimonadota bacterium]
MPKIVACPACGAAVPWNASSTFRPFCSERCKTIDLGDWAAERHVIVGQREHADESSRDESVPPMN